MEVRVVVRSAAAGGIHPTPLAQAALRKAARCLGASYTRVRTRPVRMSSARAHASRGSSFGPWFFSGTVTTISLTCGERIS
jgi:hypothetical protein